MRTHAGFSAMTWQPALRATSFAGGASAASMLTRDITGLCSPTRVAGSSYTAMSFSPRASLAASTFCPPGSDNDTAGHFVGLSERREVGIQVGAAGMRDHAHIDSCTRRRRGRSRGQHGGPGTEYLGEDSSLHRLSAPLRMTLSSHLGSAFGFGIEGLTPSTPEVRPFP